MVKDLKAAVCCFATNADFAGAVLAANLGDDADTTAAVYGQQAGAHYGGAVIPRHWRETPAVGDLIADLADRPLAGGAACCTPA